MGVNERDGTVRAGARGLVTRERILDAASELFYAHGIRATSADRIIERAGVTKVTFYRHFPAKDDVIVAYLDRRAGSERAAFDEARETAGGDPLGTFDALAEGIGVVSCLPGFRGCAFINAAAEYPEAEHPVRVVVDRHRMWFTREVAAVLTAAGVSPADDAVDEIVMLRDGAMVSGYLSDPVRAASALGRGFRDVIAARLRPDRASAS